MRVVQWGNTLAVRLAASLVQALDRKAGDVASRVADLRTCGIEPEPEREALLRHLREFRGPMPADVGFDRDEADAR